jgi:hypothetical protein
MKQLLVQDEATILIRWMVLRFKSLRRVNELPDENEAVKLASCISNRT